MVGFIILIIFLLEFCMQLVLDHYLFSFYFFLDLIAALSMIPDIGFLQDWITQVLSGGGASAH